jgi:urease accessory protein
MRADVLLAALQLGDSALPIGRFAHSLGLEAYLRADSSAGEDEIAELVESYLLESAGPLDGVAIAAAHRAEGVEALLRLDDAVSARKLTQPARLASVGCGRRLAELVLFLDIEPATVFCARVRAGTTDGNLAVVEGTVAAALGLSTEQAVLLELRGAAWTLLSAAVRLGRLASLRAQVLLRRLEPSLLQGVADALSLSPELMRSTLPELEIYALMHERASARSFVT